MWLACEIVESLNMGALGWAAQGQPVVIERVADRHV